MSAEIKITNEIKTTSFMEVVVNGKSQGKVAINGSPTLLATAKSLAKDAGINTFVVSINEVYVTDEHTAKSTVIKDGDKVEVKPKDSRGAGPRDGEDEEDGAILFSV
jgi:sulfur carrier protein ThiS